MGDKCTQFYCHVEKRNIVTSNKTIPELINDDSKQFSNQSDTLKTRNFLFTKICIDLK